MQTLAVLAAAHHITVNVPPSGGGLSTGSALVALGGVLAAVGAVVAAWLTARAAQGRLEATIANEKARLTQQLAAEEERIRRQLDHELRAGEVARARAVLEEAVRIVTRTSRRISSMSSVLLD